MPNLIFNPGAIPNGQQPIFMHIRIYILYVIYVVTFAYKMRRKANAAKRPNRNSWFKTTHFHMYMLHIIMY